jgi:hypothetical protein
VRGRRTRNLYRAEFGDPLLETKVGATRRALGLDEALAPTMPVDVVSFAAWAFLALLSLAVHVAAPVAVGLAALLLLRG